MVALTKYSIETYIRRCISEAVESMRLYNPPFGCLIIDTNGLIVAVAHNTVWSACDPTAHAEINALRMLAKKLGTVKFQGYTLFANAECCPMCSSACIKAGLTAFYYGAPMEPGSVPGLSLREVAWRANLPIAVYGPILEEECRPRISHGRAMLAHRPSHPQPRRVIPHLPSCKCADCLLKVGTL